MRCWSPMPHAPPAIAQRLTVPLLCPVGMACRIRRRRRKSRACRLLCPHAAQGYGTVLDNEANNLSVGQRQLLTIARVFLADPAMLIFDEATSSVDTRTEQAIAKAMNAPMANRTSFVIAHRLSTIRDADLILYMEHGDIVEHGTHEQLLGQKGAYAKLHNSQFA